MDYQIGCDPEFFLKNTLTGLPVSAHGVVPGTKKEPFVVDDGALQVDGMALEFNTNPARTFNEFNHNIVSVMAVMRSIVPPSFEFDITGSVVFDDATLDAMPDVAKELGCDPDFNAYTLDANPRPSPPVPGLRTASGHIHLGIGQFDDPHGAEHMELCGVMMKALDRFCGTTSVIMDPDPTRRQLYGRAGAFRPKVYGGEYRVPSNAWIATEETRREMFDMVKATMDWLSSDNITRNVPDADVIDAINRSDVEECRAIRTFMLEGR